VCQGFYHGSTGAANREALHQATEEEARELLKEHGFKEGETRYQEQMRLPQYQEEMKTMPNVKLDRETIRELLRKADEKWFANHGGLFKYQEHLEFTTEYLVKHYKGGNNADNPFHDAHSGSPGRLEAKAKGGHPDTPRQGQLNH